MPFQNLRNVDLPNVRTTHILTPLNLGLKSASKRHDRSSDLPKSPNEDCIFSTSFSMVCSPNRVRMPLKSASKRHARSSVMSSKSSFGEHQAVNPARITKDSSNMLCVGFFGVLLCNMTCKTSIVEHLCRYGQIDRLTVATLEILRCSHFLLRPWIQSGPCVRLRRQGSFLFRDTNVPQTQV